VGALLIAPTAHAEIPGCVTVDYQGAPADLCPEPVPDPTNCYTGDYQGAPIEVCMPTGQTLPEGTTIGGEPVVIHNATGYTPPAVEQSPQISAPSITTSTPPIMSVPPLVYWVLSFLLAWS
jgi:hypothetical protein